MPEISNRGRSGEYCVPSWSSIESNGISGLLSEPVVVSLESLRFFVEDVLKVSCKGSSAIICGSKVANWT